MVRGVQTNRSLARVSILVAVALIAGLSLTGCKTTSTGHSKGERLAASAAKQFKLGNYTNASKFYLEAQSALQTEGKPVEAEECRERAQTCLIYENTYPYSEAELRGILARSFPTVTAAERNRWITSGALEHVTIDGATRYFSDVVANIKYRNKGLFAQDAGMVATFNRTFEMVVNRVIPGAQAVPGRPYIHPATYQGAGLMSVPRDRLPASGSLRLWFPVPVVEGPQQAVAVAGIEPAEYLRFPPSIDMEISLAYLSVPLSQLRSNLDVSTPFAFSRYEERYLVDPAKAGAYEKSSPEYKQYTASYGNIDITPDIKKTAQKIVGGDKNPYTAAQKLYHFIVANVKYSLMPHTLLWPRGQSESEYVHERKYGDAGGQSMYFCALARSLGIPARTTAGYQLFTGEFGGHFWAEFFVPNYGWVPVDTSMGQVASYCAGAAPPQKKQYVDYYFANLDNMRCAVQKDVDVPLIPPVTELPLLESAILSPAVNCPTMPGVPGATLAPFFRMELLQAPAPE
ncbi:MAG: transglutaminase-like domain-containing protein [Candidatus Geothermincolia bacterium]